MTAVARSAALGSLSAVDIDPDAATLIAALAATSPGHSPDEWGHAGPC